MGRTSIAITRLTHPLPLGGTDLYPRGVNSRETRPNMLSSTKINLSLAKVFLKAIALALWMTVLVQGQTSEREAAKQFWPEVDVYWRLKPKVRLFFMVARTKETGKSTETDLGASIDFFVKKMVKLKRVAGRHVDESKESPLMLRAGYHRIVSSGESEQRMVFEASPRYPLMSGAVVSARNRIELRFRDDYSWRFRTRIMGEREFAIGRFSATPYVRAEFYYDSKAAKWSRTAITAGSTFPIRKRSEIELYVEHQNDTADSPNRQVNALGIAFSIHF